MEKQKVYLKYKEDFDTSNLMSIVNWVITVLGVLLLILVPVFCVSVNMPDANEKNMSILDELLYGFKALSNNGTVETITEEGTSSSSGTSITRIITMIFPLLTVIFGVITAGVAIKSLVETISEKGENSYMIRYAQIKKSGAEKEKKKFFAKQSFYTFFFYVLFTLFYSKVIGLLGASNNSGEVSDTVSLINLKGLSDWGYIGISLILIYVVIGFIKKKTDNRILRNILKEEFENDSNSEEKKEETL